MKGPGSHHQSELPHPVSDLPRQNHTESCRIQESQNADQLNDVEDDQQVRSGFIADAL